MTHTVNLSYDLANWPEIAPEVQEAADKMTDTQRRLITAALDHQGCASFSNLLQVPTSDQRRMFSLRELMDSAKNETSQQRIMPAAVRNILFGPDGLIRRSGGGRAERLMEDIEVAYIVQPSRGIEIGPIITSGRNRLMSIQALLKAAAPEALIDDVQIRCTTLQLPDRDSVERRIVSANMGSRNMAQAEIRERRAGGKGLNASSRKALIESLSESTTNKVYAPAFGALLKLCAIEKNLNGLTIDQYAQSGVTTYNSLAKANKDLNKRVDNDTELLVKLADCACEYLEGALPEVEANKARGSKAHKLARILTRKVAERYQLSVLA